MNSRYLKRFLIAIVFVGFLYIDHSARAQEITYYSFDSGPDNFQRDCLDPAQTEGTVHNALFCFNDANNHGSAGVDPAFISEACSEGDPRCPYSGSGTAIRMTTISPNAISSVFFSAPQKVVNGFTAYFAFRLTRTSGSGEAGDGIAFVLQNAQPNDPMHRLQSRTSKRNNGFFCGSRLHVLTGSGPNVVSFSDNTSSIGYAGITNSLAIEFDTFANGGDGDTNNHIAVQSCGSAPNWTDHLTRIVPSR